MEKFTGFHSTINVIDLDPNTGLSTLHFLDKRYGPKAHGFLMQDAAHIVTHMRNFSHIASEIGLPVVQAAGHVIYNNGHEGRVDLAEYVPNMGQNLLTVMGEETKNGNIAQATSYFEQYLGMFRRVWNDGFRISLDPPLTNFCVDSQQKLWYVDCMPPRQKLKDGSYISEWPTPPEQSRDFIVERYFSPQQARIIYAQALRACTHMGFPADQIKKYVVDILGDEAANAITIQPEERQRMLHSPLPTDVDALRIIASEAHELKQLGKDQLAAVYQLCHIGIGGILPTQEEVNSASALLRQ